MFNTPLTEDEQKTLDWLDEVCKQAFTEARAGSLALISHLGRNDSVGYYINNVVTRGVMTREQFATQYRGSHLKAAALVRAEYEAVQTMRESAEKTSKLEEGLEALKALVEAQAAEITALKEAAKKPAPAKKKPDAAEDESEA